MKRSKMTLARRHKIAGILFSLPFITGFLLFFLAPLIRSIYYSFTQISISGGASAAELIGWENYYRLFFVLPTYKQIIVRSLQDFVMIFPAILLYSLFIAVVLNAKFRGRIFFRVIFFIPIILNSGFILFNMNDSLLSGMMGMLNGETARASAGVNLTESVMQFLPVSDGAFVTLVKSYVGKITTIINSSGIQILIYLAGLQTISPSIYEASNIEGASAWDNVWKITFPIMSPYLLVNAVYTVIDQLAGQGNSVILAVRDIIFGGYNALGLASALSWAYIIIILVVLAIVFFVINRFVFYEN